MNPAGPVVVALCLIFYGGASALPAQDVPEDPPMPGAPEQFRVGLTVSAFDWEDEPALNAVQDGPVYGAEVETLVHPFLTFRFGVALGRPEIRSATERTSTDQFVVELLAGLRLPVDPLVRWGVVPFLAGGYGSVIHAPDRNDLITKNQSAYLVGAGVEYELLEHVGVRGEWRQARVEFNDLFDPEDRDATMREVNRWSLGVFWRF